MDVLNFELETQDSLSLLVTIPLGVRGPGKSFISENMEVLIISDFKLVCTCSFVAIVIYMVCTFVYFQTYIVVISSHISLSVKLWPFHTHVLVTLHLYILASYTVPIACSSMQDQSALLENFYTPFRLMTISD